MVNKYPTATPYIASYVLLRDGNKAAFVLRTHTSWMNGMYGLPSGKVEPNETFTQAAIREAREEVGVTIKPSALHHVLTVHRQDEIDWVDEYFEVEGWTGQPHNAEPHMHSELAWLELDNLPDNIIPSVRQALLDIKAGKTYAEFGWQE